MPSASPPASAPAPTPTVSRAVAATRGMFLLSGMAMAAWAPMVPYVKARFALDDARLGMVLLAFGAGSVLAMPLGGLLSHRLGARTVIVASALALCLALPALALAPSVPLLVVALLYFSAALGALDVSMNAHAVEVERRLQKAAMSGFHGVFSVGGLIGAAGMSALLGAGLPLLAGAVLVAVLLLGVLLWQRGGLLRHAASTTEAVPLRLPQGPVLLLGALCFVCLLAEGAMLDWSAVLLREHHGLAPSVAGLGYAAFSVAMALGRLGGDRLVAWLGPVRTVAFGAVLAAAGLFLASTGTAAGSGLLGCVLVGLGASNLVPVMFGAAGRMPGTSPALALATLTTLGYTGLLAGPALIGFLAHAIGLPLALAAVAALLLLVAAAARLVRR